MNHTKTIQRLACFLVLGLVFLAIASPVQAFTPRSGNNIVIPEGQVIDDDLYVAGDTVTVLGTIKGDLIAAGNVVTLGPTGIVEGDMMAAGQGVVINGEVAGAARIAGMALSVGKDAKIGRDLVGFAYSLEIAPGATVAKDLVYYGGQASISSSVGRNIVAGAGSLELNGQVGGDVRAEVGSPEQRPNYNPVPFMRTVPGMPVINPIPGGFTLGQGAKIQGNLTYTSAKDINIPAGAVTGSVTRNTPPQPKEQPRPQPVNPALSWFFKLLRNLVTLLLIGFLLAWLAPALLREGAAIAKAKPLQGFLWGIVSYIGLIFLMILLAVVVVIVAILLGIITLGDLTGAVLSLGGLAFGALAVGFKLAASYISKILVGVLAGQLLLGAFKSNQVEHRYWPMVIGVVVFALLASIPVLGVVINVLVVLLGLGALWMLGMEWWKSRRTVVAPAVV